MRVVNWDRWQSYRNDRGQPPWIKVHRCVMRNPEWVSLTDAQRGQLISIWLLAADRNGVLPDDPKLIQRLCFMTDEPDLTTFISLGFLDAKPTPRRRQRDTPEKRQRQSRNREETDALAHARDPLPEWLDADAWSEWEKHRSEIRKPLKPSTVRAQWRKLDACRADGHDPADVIEHSIAGGYTGLYAPDKPRTANEAHRGRSMSAVERVERANRVGAFAEPDREPVGEDDEDLRPPMVERIR